MVYFLTIKNTIEMWIVQIKALHWLVPFDTWPPSKWPYWSLDVSGHLVIAASAECIRMNINPIRSDVTILNCLDICCLLPYTQKLFIPNLEKMQPEIVTVGSVTVATFCPFQWMIIAKHQLPIWQYITSELNFTTFSSKQWQWDFPPQVGM